MKKICLFFIIAAVLLNITAFYSFAEEPKPSMLFKLDSKENKIIAPAEKVTETLKLDLVSVTVDQPQYWPWEEVHLVVLMPGRPKQEIEISVEKRDASPKELGKFTLSEDGILVTTVLNGKKEKLELGEYKAYVHTADNTLQGTAEFSVVEGALGALSLAYEFRQLTDAKDLTQAKGGWFMGNASGAGLRWGNGLNIKNELRVSNLPYSGKATLKTRCFLPGCDGVEAGPPKDVEIKDGIIEAVMDVGGHSGPFELEVITDKGSVKHLFEASGHMEREMLPITSGMTYLYRAGLAPYEGTTQVPGRQIYIEKDKEVKDDPVELSQVFSGTDNKITLSVRKPLENARIYVWTPEASGKFVSQEVTGLPANIGAGQKITVSIKGPYSVITAGGWALPKKDFWEGFAIIFTPSGLKVSLDAQPIANPNSEITVGILTKDINGKAMATAGVLEVFDNRVAGKNPSHPLTSCIGDSLRNISNSLSSWEDLTGMDWAASRPSFGAGGAKAKASFMMMEAAAPVGSLRGGGTGELEVPEEKAAEGEALRQGEEKVVFCDLVKTDASGKANIKVKLPPQTGRCNIRFVAVKDLDYTSSQKTIDVAKKAYVECHLQPLLIPGCKIMTQAFVFNAQEKEMTLKISGAGLDNPLTFTIKPGSQEIEFALEGKNYGKLFFELTDASGKLQDKRELEVKNVGSLPVTFSRLLISQNQPVQVQKGENAAVYANAAGLLKGIVMNITTTMYSWFGHAEALSAACSARAILLEAIDKGIINDEGLRLTLKTDLEKAVRDLRERFFDASAGLFSPYPGIQTNTLWSAWTARNLNVMVAALKNSPRLAQEFSDTIKSSQEMIDKVNQTLEKLGQPIPELAGYDPKQSNREVIPVEIDGQVYYKVITDDAVVQWAVKKFLPKLDLPNQENIDAAFIKAYDTWRFLRAFEHTGLLPYLIQNAKAVWLAGEKERANFYPLFSQIAKGVIASQEPGMIQGPALLGGVYSSPQTTVRFLELLLLMSQEPQPAKPMEVTVIQGNKKQTLPLTDKPVLAEAKAQALKILAPLYAVIRIDQKKTIALSDYASKKACFKIKLEKDKLGMGQEGRILIELDKDKDPFEYYAIIALPSTVSLRQTEDILSDYKGQLLYGQKAAGAVKVQLVTVPFRGSRQMVLSIEGAQKGASIGYVLVRHLNNPDDIATVEIPEIEVR